MSRGAWLVASGLIVAVFVGSAVVYGMLPERVPIHWNLQGQADGFGPKGLAAFLLPGILVGMLLMFASLPWLSPSQFGLDGFRATYGYIVVVVLAMMSFIHAVTLIAALGYRVDVTRVVVAGILLGLGLMGNVLGKVRRNFFVGVRVPWTLASERVWNDTHRLAAWLFFGGGLFGAAASLAGYPLVGLASLVPIVLVPIVYSAVRYKQLERRGEV